MMNVQTTNFILKNTKHQILKFEKTKLVIGASEVCDIKVDSHFVSELHSLLMITPEGIRIKDLESKNGLFINGQKVKEGIINDGDTFTLGDEHFTLLEGDETYPLFVHDQAVNLKEEKEERIIIPKASTTKEVLIDDEYCNIIFEDLKVELKDSPLHLDLKLDKNYIELEESVVNYEIVRESDEESILVTVLSLGNILNQSYFKINDKPIFISGRKNKNNEFYFEFLEKTQKIPFITSSGDHFIVSPFNDFKIETTDILKRENTIIMSNGPIQIMIEITNTPSKIKNIPFWLREIDFYKDSAKVMASLFLPFLLLLFVNFETKEEIQKKEVAVIYKKAKKIETPNKNELLKSSITDSQDSGTTPDPIEKKLSEAQAKKSNTKKKPQKVAKTQKAKQPEKAKPKKEVVKAYSFDMKPNLKNLFNKDNKVAVSERESASTNSNSLMQNSALDSAEAGSYKGEVNALALDGSGRAKASGGIRGLASKKGFESSYIEPKTVVLGSMDPELLRKILSEYIPQFRHCYQQELTRNSDDIQGIIDLNFEIMGTGKVSKIKIKTKDSRFSKSGIDCMGQVLSIINFPRPKGGGRVAVRQPLSFFSEKERG